MHKYQRIEIVKFGCYECEAHIYPEGNVANLTIYCVKYPYRKIFRGKKLLGQYGGVKLDQFKNTYKMALYFINYDDSNDKYYI